MDEFVLELLAKLGIGGAAAGSLAWLIQKGYVVSWLKWLARWIGDALMQNTVATLKEHMDEVERKTDERFNKLNERLDKIDARDESQDKADKASLRAQLLRECNDALDKGFLPEADCYTLMELYKIYKETYDGNGPVEHKWLDETRYLPAEPGGEPRRWHDE